MALVAAALAQAQAAAGAASGAQPPVAYASVSELNGMLGAIAADGAEHAIRSRKRRASRNGRPTAATKQQTLANVESIQRNLQSALPEIIAQLNNSPEDLGASFKLYRNLDALYDVFGSVVE